ESDIGNQSPEPFPPRSGRARLSLVGVDHDDALVNPAECCRAPSQCVLTLRTLDVLDDLLHRRLSNVQVRVTLEMVRLDFARFVHGSSVSSISWPASQGAGRL